MQHQQRLTPLSALPKAKHYCAWQERCHSEVAEKLFVFGLTEPEVAQIISTLIEENFLNEERFAILYAGGHFRTKHWGRVKIRYELKKKQVSPYCIKKALASIDEVAYEKTLQQLAEQKLKMLKNEKNIFVIKRKMQDYLLGKGFESELVRQVINAK